MFKSAAVTPLLKKPSLDPDNPANYRPISNLNNISKIIERLFLSRLPTWSLRSPNFNRPSVCLSASPLHRNRTPSNFWYIFCSEWLTVNQLYLTSLDLSAAFDTIDHSDTSFTSLGLALDVSALHLLGWHPDLTNRAQTVRHWLCFFWTIYLSLWCADRALSLDPFLFSLYISPIGQIVSDFPHFSSTIRRWRSDSISVLKVQLLALPSPTLKHACPLWHSWLCFNGLSLQSRQIRSHTLRHTPTASNCSRQHHLFTSLTPRLSFHDQITSLGVVMALKCCTFNAHKSLHDVQSLSFPSQIASGISGVRLRMTWLFWLLLHWFNPASIIATHCFLTCHVSISISSSVSKISLPGLLSMIGAHPSNRFLLTCTGSPFKPKLNLKFASLTSAVTFWKPTCKPQSHS